MRHLYIIALFACLVTSLGIQEVKGQSPREALNAMVDCFLTGSADNLARHLNSSVEINMYGERKVYAATQAKFVLREWFAKHPCYSFQILHTGNSDGYHYARGDYRGKTTSFWVTLFMQGSKLSKLKIVRK